MSDQRTRQVRLTGISDRYRLPTCVSEICMAGGGTSAGGGDPTQQGQFFGEWTDVIDDWLDLGEEVPWAEVP